MAIHLRPGDTICLSGSTRERRDQLRSLARAAGLRLAARPGRDVTCVRGLYSLSRDRRRPALTGLALQPLLSEPAFVAQCERLQGSQARKATAKAQVASILAWLEQPANADPTAVTSSPAAGSTAP